MSTPKPDFKAILTEGGIPTDEDGIRAKFQEALQEAESIYSNPAEISPFKRLFTALIITPVMWLIEMLFASWMPQAFALTATGAFLEALAWMVKLTRKLAVKAQGRLTFTRDNTSGELVIPLGTIIDSVSIDGRIYQLITIEEQRFLDAESTITVLCEAMEAGSAYNLQTGMYSIVPESLPSISSVTNAEGWLTQPGSNREEDDELRERMRNQFNGVNQWHIDAVYRSIISGFDGVLSQNIYFDNAAPRGPATCNAYILLETGNPAPAFLTEIQNEIMVKGNKGHGDDIQLLAMPETQHDLVVSVFAVPGTTDTDKTELMQNVENFIRAAFRQNQVYQPTLAQPFDRFSFSRLAHELHLQFPLLDRVDLSAAEIVSGREIPRLNQLSINDGEAR